MTTDETRKITAERLAAWADLLAQDNATPMLLLGCGHGDHRGTAVVCVTEDMPDADVRAMVRGVLAKLEGRFRAAMDELCCELERRGRIPNERN